MSSSVSRVVQQFLSEHPEELVNGKLKVCVGGGAGFIGSHIAKQLMAEVRLEVPYLDCDTLSLKCHPWCVGMLCGLRRLEGE